MSSHNYLQSFGDYFQQYKHQNPTTNQKDNEDESLISAIDEGIIAPQRRKPQSFQTFDSASISDKSSNKSSYSIRFPPKRRFAGLALSESSFNSSMKGSEIGRKRDEKKARKNPFQQAKPLQEQYGGALDQELAKLIDELSASERQEVDASGADDSSVSESASSSSASKNNLNDCNDDCASQGNNSYQMSVGSSQGGCSDAPDKNIIPNEGSLPFNDLVMVQQKSINAKTKKNLNLPYQDQQSKLQLNSNFGIQFAQKFIPKAEDAWQVQCKKPSFRPAQSNLNHNYNIELSQKVADLSEAPISFSQGPDDPLGQLLRMSESTSRTKADDKKNVDRT